MTIKNNGRKRSPKYLFGSLFLLFVGLLCLYLTIRDGMKVSWIIITAAVLFFSVRMFARSNEQ